MTSQKLNLNILGMSCGHCEKTIQQALEKMDGVMKAEIDHKKEQGIIDFNPHQIHQEDIENKIIELGYSIKKGKIQTWLEKMAKSNEKSFGHGKMDCCSIRKN